MSQKQWGHGWHTGHAAGEAFGEVCGAGGEQLRLAPLADRLTIIARALIAEADRGTSSKSAEWWALYATVVGKQLLEISEQLPGVLANFAEQPQSE